MPITALTPTIQPHEFMIKFFQECEQGEHGYDAQEVIARMLLEVAIPEEHKKQVTAALLCFAASGNIYQAVEDEFAKGLLRLGGADAFYEFYETCEESQLDALHMFGNSLTRASTGK